MRHEYLKPEAPEVRGTCVKCRERQQRRRARDHRGTLYGPLCQKCERARPGRKRQTSTEEQQKRWARNRKTLVYRTHKKDRCEWCNFVPVDMCQLDVDHRDGNHANDEPSNLQTLCANCHRLKTMNDRRGTAIYPDGRALV